MPDREVSIATFLTVGPLVDSAEYTLEESVAWNAAGMDLMLHEVAYDGGVHTNTAITLTTGGDFDWAHLGNGYYSVEITAAVLNTIGEAWLEGHATGIYPFRSPVYNILPTNIYDAKYSTTLQDVNTKTIANGIIVAATLGADAITAAKIADDAISSEHINTGAFTADAFAADALIAATFATGAFTADAFAADALVAATFATDAIAADGLAADAVTEIVTAIFAKTGLTAGGTASFNDIVKALYAYSRGKIIRTGDANAYKDDDDSTTVQTLTAATGGRGTS